MEKFLCKGGASLYYLRDESAGSFLTPPGHATQRYSIIEKRGGHECGFMSLEGAISESWIPATVKHTATKLLKQHPGDVKSEEWINAVYTYMRHCYRTPSGEELTFGKFWDNADKEQEQPATNHRAYLYILKYDPTHTPRIDLF